MNQMPAIEGRFSLVKIDFKSTRKEQEDFQQEKRILPCLSLQIAIASSLHNWVRLPFSKIICSIDTEVDIQQ
jgi:hypothetical protein